MLGSIFRASIVASKPVTQHASKAFSSNHVIHERVAFRIAVPHDQNAFNDSIVSEVKEVGHAIREPRDYFGIQKNNNVDSAQVRNEAKTLFTLDRVLMNTNSIRKVTVPVTIVTGEKEFTVVEGKKRAPSDTTFKSVFDDKPNILRVFASLWGQMSAFHKEGVCFESRATILVFGDDGKEAKNKAHQDFSGNGKMPHVNIVLVPPIHRSVDVQIFPCSNPSDDKSQRGYNSTLGVSVPLGSMMTVDNMRQFHQINVGPAKDEHDLMNAFHVDQNMDLIAPRPLSSRSVKVADVVGDDHRIVAAAGIESQVISLEWLLLYFY